jgi:hypothetical protein
MAILAVWRVGKPTQLTNSAFKVETNDSAMALSRADPVLPIEGRMATSSSRFPKDREVYGVHPCHGTAALVNFSGDRM